MKEYLFAATIVAGTALLSSVTTMVAHECPVIVAPTPIHHREPALIWLAPDGSHRFKAGRIEVIDDTEECLTLRFVPRPGLPGGASEMTATFTGAGVDFGLAPDGSHRFKAGKIQVEEDTEEFLELRFVPGSGQVLIRDE